MRFLSMAMVALVFASTAVTAAAAATSCDQLQMLASIPLRVLPGGRVAVSLNLMDRPSVLLFDTGGFVRSLTQKTVHELGLPTYEGNVGLRNVRGQLSYGHVTVPSVTLGGVKIKNVQFLVLPGGDEKSVASPGSDGVFTMDLLRGTDFDLDFGANKLNIFSDKHCDGRVVYWPADKIAVVPYDLDRGNHLTFQVTLDGKRLDAILDTGATSSTVDLSVARDHLGVDLNGPDVERVGELAPGHPMYRHRFKTLALEGVEIGNPMLTLIPNMMGKPDVDTATRTVRDKSNMLPPVILGMSMLNKLHVYIATKEHKLYITAASHETKDSPH